MLLILKQWANVHYVAWDYDGSKIWWNGLQIEIKFNEMVACEIFSLAILYI